MTTLICVTRGTQWTAPAGKVFAKIGGAESLPFEERRPVYFCPIYFPVRSGLNSHSVSQNGVVTPKLFRATGAVAPLHLRRPEARAMPSTVESCTSTSLLLQDLYDHLRAKHSQIPSQLLKQQLSRLRSARSTQHDSYTQILPLLPAVFLQRSFISFK